jgi:geranylgeranyl pyrophosphate synthase
VELGHNFSLVHDDIEDQDVERRHRAALWTVVGVPQAINTGDTLFVLSRLALHRLTEIGFPDAKVLALTRLYDETCLALCEGQFLDIWTSEHGDEPIGVDLYFDMIGRKTAALIAASIKSGAMLATDDEHVIDSYHRFGWALGIAFQLNDDLLGIWGEEQTTGKEPSDLAKHKKTLPVLYALEHAGPEDRERLTAIVRATEVTDADIAERAGDPRPHRCERVHPVTGAALSRRGDRAARGRGRDGRSRRRAAAGHHRVRDQRLATEAPATRRRSQLPRRRTMVVGSRGPCRRAARRSIPRSA